MQARLQRHLVLDVETIGKNIVFDIAWSIGTKHAIEKTKGYIVKEIYNIKNITNFPFHGEKKFLKYEAMLRAGQTTLMAWSDIMRTFWEDIKLCNPIIWAYNVVFDCRAIYTTNQAIRGRQVKMFDNVRVFDLYTSWCTNMKTRKDYSRFCAENGYMSAAGNIRTTAETAIRYIRRNPGYIEQHTAAQDTIDEFSILQWLIHNNKKRNIKAIPHPWKLVNPRV